ncbi:MAG: Spy/CpxP family protein refolding chaperone [Gemmatimonadetes bacterium]|nr:Spy/CpxP family protein refolding chaperone [Gemmatimonadota bacterium]
MRAAIGNPAEAVLRLREPLALTEEQVKRLEALALSQREGLTPSGPDLLRARADLLEATSPDIDLNAARVALERMSRLRTEAALARLRARKEVRDVLTPEQRSKLDNLRRPGARRLGFPGHPRMETGPTAPPPPELP